MGTAYIVDAVRTPRGRGKKGSGALANLHPQELLAQTQNGLRRTAFDPADVEDAVIGCVQLVDELERQDKTRGVVAMCIGGGMGIATIVERV